MDKPKILLVDDEPNNLKLLKQILQDDYTLLFAIDGESAINAAFQHHPSLILLDIMMPDKSGYDVCEILKTHKKTEDIPVIFVSAMSDIKDEAHGFDLGAVDYILKPVSAPIVKRRVKTHLSLVRTKDLEKLVKESIKMLGEAGHYNDTDTGEHIWRMAAYAGAIARAVGWDNKEVQTLMLAAPMHDTGKIGIPDEILKAPRSLTEEEWKIMKTHAEIGSDILKQSRHPVFKMASEIAQNHHEKWDGSGYPNGFQQNDIPESARIVAIADVFDALTMKRPYKEPWPTDKAFDTIKSDAGKHFDPYLVSKFLSIKDEILELKEHWQDK